jgi:hypothetical protein
MNIILTLDAPASCSTLLAKLAASTHVKEHAQDLFNELCRVVPTAAGQEDIRVAVERVIGRIELIKGRSIDSSPEKRETGLRNSKRIDSVFGPVVVEYKSPSDKTHSSRP